MTSWYYHPEQEPDSAIEIYLRTIDADGRDSTDVISIPFGTLVTAEKDT